MNQLGVFIIWQSGEEYAQDIIEDIHKLFNIIEVQTLQWDKDIVGENLNKLYPHREFDYKSAKVKEVGADVDGVRLHLIIVSDNNINIKNDINLNLKNLKGKYRKEYKVNFLHSSDNQEEAIDNIKNILEYDDKQIDSLINSNIDKYILYNYYDNKLMSSTRNKFYTVKDVFKKLDDEKLLWVVLRNWDELDNDIVSLEHGDVDIMVDDFYKTILVLNATRGTKLKYRVQYKVNIDNRYIPFDIRHIGDNYYDESWEKEILNTKEQLDYFYIPNQDNYYFSLLYHTIVHKPKLSDEYYNKLTGVKQNSHCLEELQSFLNKNNYQIVKPNDKSVYYRYSKEHYIYIIKQFLKRYKIVKGLISWIKK